MTRLESNGGREGTVDMTAALGSDALDAARRAARRAGLPLEQWLQSTILDTAGTASDRDSPTGRDPTSRDWARPDRAGSPGAIADALQDVTRRLDGLMREPANHLAAAHADELRATVSRLGSRLDSLLDGARPAPARRYPSDLDGALAEISARRRSLDGAPAGHPALDPAPRPRPVSDEGIGQLRRDIGDIARSLSGFAPRRSVDTLETSLRALQARVEAQKAPALDVGMLSEMTRMLSEIREGMRSNRPAEAIAALGDDLKGLDRKLDRLSDAAIDPMALQHLTDQIADLRAGMGQIAAADPTRDLAAELRDLAAKVDRIVDQTSDGAAALELMATIERRVETLDETLAAGSARGAGQAISELRERLDHMQHALEKLALAAPANVERSILLVVDKLDRLQGLVSAAPDLSGIGSRLDIIVERLDESEARLGQLRAIEHAINDLFAQFEDMRASTIEAARAGGASPAMDGLLRDVSDLRSAQRTTEVRTHETLEAVHGTLERVVDRLAMLEEDLVRPPEHADRPLLREDDDARPAHAPIAAPPIVPAAAAPAFKASALPAEDLTTGALPIAPELPGLGDLPPDHPIEPGTFAKGRGGASAAERTGAPQAALAPGATNAAEPTSRESFIAAARRAAQQANADVAGQSAPGSASGKSGGTLATLGATFAKRKLILLFGLGLVGFLLALPKLIDLAAPLLSDPPTIVAPVPLPDPPAAERSEGAPAKASDPSVPGKQSRIATDRVMAAVPPSGVIGTTPAGAAPTVPSGAFLPAAPEQTGSIPQPAPAASADGLPPAIGPLALRSAASANDPAAMFEIAARFAEGRGVPANPTEAARWFQRAAVLGLAPAAYRLGSLYEKGNGVPRDLQTARRLYTQAADAGNAKAMHNLAVLMAEGIDGKPDYKAAAALFRKAADRGVRDSQYNLAVLYARGLGVDQNLAESFKWFALAANQGDADATKKREDVAARLDAQTLLAARLAAQSFAPQSIDDSANAVRVSPDWTRAEVPMPAPRKPTSGRT